MEIELVRHLKTKGNFEKRYIGKTDEPLMESKEQDLLVAEMKKKIMTPVERVVVSPLKRCKETAQRYFPNIEVYEQNKLRESDFGLFENKNYEELKTVPEYQKWLDSNGTLPFPEGESHEDFLKRCKEGFEETINSCIRDDVRSVVFVIHGGSIMAILSQFSEKKSEFYDWMLGNGEAYHMRIDEMRWLAGERQVKEIRKL